MRWSGYKPRLPETSKYRRHGRNVRAKAKYKAVMQEIAYCHDTGTRFDNQTCADLTGHSLTTVKRVLRVLAEAGVILITNPGTKARSVKLATGWLDFWKMRFPQVAELRDAQRGKTAPDWDEARGAAKGRQQEAETGDWPRTGPVEMAQTEPVASTQPDRTGPHNGDTAHARDHGIVPQDDMPPWPNDPHPIDERGDWVPLGPYDD